MSGWLQIPWVAGLVAFVESSKYAILFFGALLEGPLFMIGGGLLYHLGSVAPWPAYLALVFGDFAGDLVWYAMGYFGARPAILRWGRFINVAPPVVDAVERQFNRYHLWVLVISKLTMGFGFALTILTVAGMLRVPLWRYATINLVCGFVWTAFLFGIGYFFGNIYTVIPDSVRLAFAISGPIITILLLRFAAGVVSKRMQQ
ncbi:MAG: DedA family protein [Patescibacteria group bacterium]|nr:DedA family protein [Patescibacteria group bacterium]